MARWITIKPEAVPFDYRWPTVTAITAFTIAGEHFVKDEIADFAVGRGYANEGKAKGSTTRSSKSGGTRRVKRSKAAAHAAPAPDILGSSDVDRADHADDGRPADRASLDRDAGER